MEFTPTALPEDSLGGKIAFYSVRDGNAEIYIMDIDGSNTERLSNNPADDMAPAISPDGTQIAFMSARDLYVMNIDGTEQQRLTNTPAYESHPDWSPDGTQIAFTSERDGNREIYVMDADGSNVQRLTYKPAEDMQPCWSPDGTKIAFSRKQDENWDIYIIDVKDALLNQGADSSSLQRLTDSGNGEVHPSWSPDGSQIAYMSSPRRASFEIWVMNADGSNGHPLPGIGQINENPVWSPDGTKIVFQSNRDGNWEIYVMDADGSNQRRLTNNPAGDYWPSWGPLTVETLTQVPTIAPADQNPTESRADNPPAGASLHNSWTRPTDGMVMVYVPGGSFQMAGNVWEWVADWDGDYPSDAQQNPTGPSTGTRKIFRSSSFNYGPIHARTTHRGRHYPDGRSGYGGYVGFRCVVDEIQE